MNKAVIFLRDPETLAKSTINVKATTRRDGAQVKAHTRTVPNFHVSREEDGDSYIDSHHTHFSAAKKRMMDIHKEDPGSSPMVHSMPHGIMAFPHVDTGKPTVTPAYRRAAKAAPDEHREHWADAD